MELGEDTVVSLLEERGEHDEADEAARELPGRVDTERDGGLLARLGVDSGDLLGRFAGGRDIPGL